MAKFRNIVVHHYDKVDAEIVVAIIKKDLKDFTGYRNAIVGFLKSINGITIGLIFAFNVTEYIFSTKKGYIIDGAFTFVNNSKPLSSISRYYLHFLQRYQLNLHQCLAHLNRFQILCNLFEIL